ncbi:MAG TPA: RtcB family protein, partial [Planctomycetota bacterium]|nr:RtcB family protein [Planctomycetota bacterium]
KGHVNINGRPGDLRKIAEDLRPWFKVSRVYSRHRKHRIRTAYGLVRTESTEHFVHINSTGFALLLAALGIPVGPKATQDWDLPPILETLPLWQQRLFVAGFFGAELTTPRVMRKANHNFFCPILVVVKREGFVESGIRFLQDLSKMLSRFGVTSLTVSRRNEQMNPDGRRSIRLRLVISGTTESLLSLWGRVGFDYNRKRSRIAALAVGYLQRKQAYLAAQDRVRRRILEIRTLSGWGAKKILAAVACESVPVNRRFVERTIYSEGERLVRAPEDFPTFREWCREWTSDGVIWEEIAARTPRPDVRRVYDLTVDHPKHRFLAGGFVVHNCGVRLIRTDLERSEVQPKIRDLVRNIFRAIPAGVGSDGAIPTPKEADALAIVTQGAKWAVDHGYGVPADLDHIEDGGLYPGADPKAVGDRAFKRGMPQVGTLGSGNHFLEIQVVDRIFRKDVAAHFGLREGTVCFSIHSGSRGFGYQVCEDNLKSMVRASEHYGIALPDRQLCCAPLSSPEAKQYLAAMACAANFAWVNRQVMTALTRRVFAQTLGVTEDSLEARLIYDVCHNIAKMEEHGGRRLCVHRKGATRAFGPGHPLLPPAYRDLGQPTFIPGDMGRASFLLIGKEGSMRETFGSTCHGAGRAHSRTAMKRMTQGRNLFRELEERGVIVMAHGRDSVAEEMPEAYKDASLVVDVMEQAGVTDKVARLVPIGCIKG